MSDRERLTEIIQNSVGGCARNWAETIADGLLANGVILPPCKVGDMVYRIAIDGKTITEERVGEIHLEFTIDDGTGWHNVWWLKEYNIGITTFLTREEAEKKLKELRGNEQKDNRTT